MMINGVQLWSERWERLNFIYFAARMHSFEALAFDNNNTMISELHVCSKILTYIENLDSEIVLNSNIYFISELMSESDYIHIWSFAMIWFKQGQYSSKSIDFYYCQNLSAHIDEAFILWNCS